MGLPLAAIDLASWAALGVSVAALAWAVVSGRRANANSSRALALSEAEHEQRERDRGAQANIAVSISVDPALGHPSAGPDVRIVTWSSSIYVTLLVTITNTGERPAGRTRVEVWAPRTPGSALRWSGPRGEELDEPLSSRDRGVRLTVAEGGPTYDSEKVTRTLDRVAVGVPEQLPVRVHFPAEQDEAAFPIESVVHAEGAAAVARARTVVHIRREAT